MFFSSIRRWRLKRSDDAPETERLFAEESGDIMLRLRPDMTPRYVSLSVETVLGWSPDEWMAEGVFSFIVDRDELQAFDEAAVASGAERSRTTFRIRHKDGSIRWVEGVARYLPPAHGEARGDLLVVLRDVTDRKQMEDELTRQATTDGLTGLANRRAFDAELSRCWMDELATAGPISLLMVDVDHFKLLNDRYGHQVGDDCLRAIAAVLQREFGGQSAIVARYGGEELVVIMPNTDETAACDAGERLRAAIEALGIPHEGNGCGVITVSVGVVTAIAREGGTIRMPEGLVLAADGMLYRAKAEGRNRVSSTILLAPDKGRIA